MSLISSAVVSIILSSVELELVVDVLEEELDDEVEEEELDCLTCEDCLTESLALVLTCECLVLPLVNSVKNKMRISNSTILPIIFCSLLNSLNFLSIYNLLIFNFI